MKEPIYRTKEEWGARFRVPDYAPNLEITNDEYDKDLAAKCINGTFVGQELDGVRMWKGIPYSKQPVGKDRFKKATAPEPSDKVFEAYHFGKTCMELLDENERASMYEQGEDCLNLNVWSSTDVNDKKPVLVFIHGGGWVQGGTSDPLYDGFNFAYYNPEILFVTITYRVGMMGQINLSGFPDGAEYDYSMNNGLRDQIQALKWVKENIAAFGGDPENVTICGESAGGCSVSALCIAPEAKGLFKKAIPMSGGVDQMTVVSETHKLPEAIVAKFGCKTVADIQKIPFEKLTEWWRDEGNGSYHHCVSDGKLISGDPFRYWEDGATKDLIILQGHTSNEFAYYRSVFHGVDELYDGICKTMVENAWEKGSDEYKKAYNEYVAALEKLGYHGDEIARQYANDLSLAFGNTYQAICHAKNGGKGFCYTFEKSYDGTFAKLGAAHAVDCHYLFGNFANDGAFGTKEEVDLSLKFQAMIANFCKTGNPSIEEYGWPEYNNETRFKMMVGDNLRVEENPEKERVDAALKMMQTSDEFRKTPQFSSVFPVVAVKYPEAFGKFIKIEQDLQKTLKK